MIKKFISEWKGFQLPGEIDAVQDCGPSLAGHSTSEVEAIQSGKQIKKPGLSGQAYYPFTIAFYTV